MPMDVFRIFRPQGERKEEQPEKRRAQVRRAQQTYRIRKDQYARALEREVARLRTREIDLVRENQRLHNLVDAQKCHQAHAVEPSWEDISAGRWNGAWMCEESDDKHLSPRSFCVSPGTHTGTLQGGTPSAGSPPAIDRGRNILLDAHPSIASAANTDQDYYPSALAPPLETVVAHRNDQPCHADLTAIGMEFVLALEAPCLGHIHGDPDNPDQANGHALTTSSYVLAFSPLPPSPDADSNAALLTEALDSAPSTILDRLVTLSTNFALEDEVTPVQAWNRIQTQLQVGAIGAEGIPSLVKKLVAAVKCHGFGAVLKTNIFEGLLREMLHVTGKAPQWI